MKSVVIYFSRAGYNYVDGQILNLKIGNTEVVAKKIAELTNSDLFKIEPIIQYSKDYSECLNEVIQDQRRNARPELEKYPENLAQYLLIYLGFPNYWGTMPMPVFTFLERVSLKGKIIKPFCSNEGSEMGRSEEDIKKICTKSKVEKGISIHGARYSEELLKKWIKESE